MKFSQTNDIIIKVVITLVIMFAFIYISLDKYINDPKNVKTYLYTCVIIDSETKTPLQNVKVDVFTSTGQKEITSDFNGKFKLKLTSSDLTYSVMHKDYKNAVWMIGLSSSTQIDTIKLTRKKDDKIIE